ncbi:O-acyltransferase like protein-like [Atheta coriaria]|uniref:O-acyltransferase like protein-like n=1 Tax=Dalotia coriaria TaxID=877792 RepID=UPI0031F38D07
MALSEIVDLELKACADQVSYVLLDDQETRLQMLDAWGKIPDGMLSGQFVSLGNYDQCINISELTPVGAIRGKYCLVKIVNLQQTFAGYGACIPEVCDVKLPFGQEIVCQTKDSYTTLDTDDYTFLTVLGVFAFIMFLSTVYDWYTRKHELKQNAYCILFSVLTNGEKLFETKIGPDQISCLAGIRVISMIWIIASHRYFVMKLLPIRNSLYAFSWLFSHESFYVQAAYLAVDTFLYLGGFVLAYQCFKNRNKLALTVPTIPYFYMHRLLRLLPPMTVIFFVHLTILRRMSSGPLYADMVEILRRPCIDHWLPYFLFYQNYKYNNFQSECLAHTWYLSVDFQLYLFTPLILIPATRLLQQNERFKCYCLFGFALLLSILVPMCIMFGIPYEYYHTHTRISPYIMGLIMGLFMVENKDRTFKIPKKLYYVIWMLTLITMCVCAYYIQNTTVFTNDYLNNNMFVTFSRPAWSLCVSWVIFSCVNQNTKTLNKFLSNSLFIVMGRLSYSMYLLQVVVLVFTMGSTRTPMLLSFWPNLHGSVCDIFLTTLLSVISVLSFESPIIALAKMLLHKKEPQMTKNH